MKELEIKFEGKGQVKGYVFTQINNTKNAYLYEVSGSGIVHYEVFKRVENTLYNCVSYPRDKSFGLWAWTFGDLCKAQQKLMEISIKGMFKNNPIEGKINIDQ